MKRILVTGAGGSAGINFVASLRMAGEDSYIVGTDTNRWHLELPDINARYVVPRCTDRSYLTKLNQIIEKEHIEFVHAQPDVEVKVLSDNREAVHARTFLPDRETIETCQDKMRSNKVLEGNNIPVPGSKRIDSAEDLAEAFKTLRKSNGKLWLRALKGAGSRASLPIIAEEQGRFWIEYWRQMKNLGYGDFMVSEFLPGKEYAFQSVWKDGQLITSAARERLEYIFGELTPSGQSSSPSVARVVHRDDINEIATRAITAIDKKISGVFCVDLKENEEGIPCVTEINAGRFFTTSNFFSALGVNMPYIYVKLAFAEEIPAVPSYNAVPEGFYWIRQMDKGPILVSEGSWRSKIL
jgi:carbamoyl-phosphate synthase large subunit